MNQISEFSFLCADGVHQFIYNPNSKISSLLVFRKGKLVSREDYLCSCEEYHIRRVQWDFNHNYLYLPKGKYYKIKSITVDALLFCTQWFMIGVASILYLVLSVIVKCLEVLNVGKKTKSKSRRKSNITLSD